MSEGGDGSSAHAATRRVIHDLRQPLAALQMWVDLLAEALRGRVGEKEDRYLAKIRGELARLTALLAASASAAATAESATSQQPGSSQGSAPSDASARLTGFSLLVVEDDELTAEALQFALEGEGATVAVAATVAAGLESFAASRPDAVLSDLKVSDGDGFTLVAEIRRRDRADGRRTAAVAVTGFDGAETRAAARAAGFDEVVLKPFAIGDLIATVARLVAAAR